MSQQKSQQVLHNRTKPLPNELLGMLIEKVNLLQTERKLLPLEVSSWDEVDEEHQEDWVSSARRSLQEKLKGHTEELQQHIWQGPTPEFGSEDDPDIDAGHLYALTRGSVARYEHLLDLRMRFQKLVAMVELAAPLEYENSIRMDIPLPRSTLRPRAASTIRIEFNDDGTPIFEPDEFSKALEGVDVRRIRECKICKRVFWAGRSDKMCCSKQHNTAYNVRLTRERRRANPDIYNQQRRQNEEVRMRSEKNKEDRVRRERLEKALGKKKLEPKRRG
jgi:hypothetical protein